MSDATADAMTAFKLNRAIGRKAFFQRSEVIDAAGSVVGEVQAHHDGSGWKGHRSEYVFTPNESGRIRGLRRASADKQRDLLLEIESQTAPGTKNKSA